MARITILGAGSFGLALANVLYENNEVVLWSREEDYFKDRNSKERRSICLPDVTIEESIKWITDINVAVEESEIVIVSVPSRAVREVLGSINNIEPNTIIVSVAKGIEDVSYLTYTQVIREIYPNNRVVDVSGPSHAEELAKGKLTALMAGGTDKTAVIECAQAFESPSLIIEESDDPIGMELCAAYKNLVALAKGINDGYELGDNTKAIIFTIACKEMEELCMKVVGTKASVYSYAGIGDLYVTVSSVYSRNRKCGKFIAEGNSFKEAQRLVGQVVESVNSFDAIKGLFKKHGIESKIIKILDSANKKDLTKNEFIKILKEG